MSTVFVRTAFSAGNEHSCDTAGAAPEPHPGSAELSPRGTNGGIITGKLRQPHWWGILEFRRPYVSIRSNRFPTKLIIVRLGIGHNVNFAKSRRPFRTHS